MRAEIDGGKERERKKEKEMDIYPAKRRCFFVDVIASRCRSSFNRDIALYVFLNLLVAFCGITHFTSLTSTPMDLSPSLLLTIDSSLYFYSTRVISFAASLPPSHDSNYYFLSIIQSLTPFLLFSVLYPFCVATCLCSC